ncbi:MAG: hypothetical protein NZ550_01170 [Fimbriimonadales bacterium]|nr:hypothetical protein [Fimbriimonadales bacterium]MDW8051424.1 hypothetical protein [Armatimonadota bacterium]
MQQTTNAMAIASLVLGILALATLVVFPALGVIWYCVPLPLILGVLAWVLGRSALTQIDAGMGNPSERGLATAGYVMGIIATVLSALLLCCAVGVLMGVIGLMLPFWKQLLQFP